MKTNILLIDHDMGLMFWLGQALDRAGFDAFPARSVYDAKQLIEQLHLSVDLAVVNFSLAGAHDFVVDLHDRGHAKIIGLVDSQAPIHSVEDWQWSKPAAADELSKMEFLLQIHQLLGLALDESNVPSPMKRVVV